MTNSLLLSVLITSSLFIITSCDDDSITTPIYDRNLWDCHHQSSWNIQESKSILIGTWELEFTVCIDFTRVVKDEKNKGITIEFKKDTTLLVRTQGEITQFATWNLRDGDADLFELDTRPAIHELHGRILFCENHVMFNDSYIDGCDHYFIKRR